MLFTTRVCVTLYSRVVINQHESNFRPPRLSNEFRSAFEGKLRVMKTTATTTTTTGATAATATITSTTITITIIIILNIIRRGHIVGHFSLLILFTVIVFLWMFFDNY